MGLPNLRHPRWERSPAAPQPVSGGYSAARHLGKTRVRSPESGRVRADPPGHVRGGIAVSIVRLLRRAAQLLDAYLRP